MRSNACVPIAVAAAATAFAAAAHGAPTPQRRPPATNEPLVVKVGDSRFRWSDAAIGAAAGFGGALVLVGGSSLYRARGRQPTDSGRR
jgi:hypothetical protein